MTIETATYVRVDRSDRVSQLVGEIETCVRRARKAVAGDTSDADKALALLSNLEFLARQAQRSGASVQDLFGTSEAPVLVRDSEEAVGLPGQARQTVEEWLAAGSIAVLVVDPLTAGRGDGFHRNERIEIPEVFRSSDSNDSAVVQRFRGQCATGGPIMPSSMQDHALTDALHEFVFSAEPAHMVPVIYADGSQGPDICFGGLSVDTTVPIARTLSLSLMSIRHMEMDATTDGAWFRNVDLSRRASHGDIDSDATTRSKEQLQQLLRGGDPVEIRLYLTGFVPASMAFYRTAAEVMRTKGGVLRVRPMFYRPHTSADGYVESPRTWSVP